MAFEKVNTGQTYTKATALAQGESFVGYYLYSEVSDQGYLNFVFHNDNGDKIYFSPAGNLKYLEKNKTPLTPGLLTKITRNGERINKKGQKVGMYDVAQDKENVTPRFSSEQLAAMNVKDTSAQTAVEQMRSA